MTASLPWRPREPPLAPVAVAGRGPAAAALLRAALRRDDDALARLRGVVGPGLVVLEGAELPWAPDLCWLGVDPAAPALRLPTRTVPDLPLDLLQTALLADLAEGSAPLALLRDPALRVPLGPARPLHRDWLHRALEDLAP